MQLVGVWPQVSVQSMPGGPLTNISSLPQWLGALKVDSLTMKVGISQSTTVTSQQDITLIGSQVCHGHHGPTPVGVNETETNYIYISYDSKKTTLRHL